MKTIEAAFLSLGLKDLAKGFITAIITAVVTGIYTSLSATPPSFPNLAELEHLGMAGLLAGIAYVMKNFLTNSAGEFLKKEPNDILNSTK